MVSGTVSGTGSRATNTQFKKKRNALLFNLPTSTAVNVNVISRCMVLITTRIHCNKVVNGCVLLVAGFRGGHFIKISASFS